MKKDILIELTEKNNGYLFTSDVVKAGISKTYLANFVKDNTYEKVAYGMYVSPDVWPDELYILQKANPLIVYAGETACYINDLMDREYTKIQVMVPSGYNAAHLRKKGIVVKSLRQDIYELGKTSVKSIQGNCIVVYDKERCVCDAILNRKSMDSQIFQTVIKEYMADECKRLSVLIQYAETMNLRDEVMKYVEVLI